jgi:hypothetical protein
MLYYLKLFIIYILSIFGLYKYDNEKKNEDIIENLGKEENKEKKIEKVYKFLII